MKRETMKLRYRVPFSWMYLIGTGRQYVWVGFWLRVPKRWHR